MEAKCCPVCELFPIRAVQRQKSLFYENKDLLHLKDNPLKLPFTSESVASVSFLIRLKHQSRTCCHQCGWMDSF